MTEATSNQWIEVALDASPEAVDAIAEVFRGQGIAGIAVEPDVEPNEDDGFTITNRPSRITAYLPDEAGTPERVLKLDEALWHLRAFDLAPISELRTRIVDEEDWANAWKEHFHPLRIGERIVVKPTWRDVETKPRDIIIELDPGMAFGTGLHPTTRMVLEAMESYVQVGDAVFDVGTGSGILAVAAAKLGARQVLAVDVESVACRVATENVKLNGVAEICRVEIGSVDAGQGGNTVVLANIIASVIAEIAEQLASQLAPGGTLITSGIIEERLPLAQSALEMAGLATIQRHQSGDWFCLISTKPVLAT